MGRSKGKVSDTQAIPQSTRELRSSRKRGSANSNPTKVETTTKKRRSSYAKSFEEERTPSLNTNDIPTDNVVPMEVDSEKSSNEPNELADGDVTLPDSSSMSSNIVESEICETKTTLEPLKEVDLSTVDEDVKIVLNAVISAEPTEAYFPSDGAVMPSPPPPPLPASDEDWDSKSESVVQDVPLSGDRCRFSRSKSPKARWRHSPTPDQHNINLNPSQNSTKNGNSSDPVLIEIPEENKEVIADVVTEQKEDSPPETESSSDMQLKIFNSTVGELSAFYVLSTNVLKPLMSDTSFPVCIDKLKEDLNRLYSDEGEISSEDEVSVPLSNAVVETKPQMEELDYDEDMSECRISAPSNKSSSKPEEYTTTTKRPVTATTQQQDAVDEPEHINSTTVSPPRKPASKTIHVKGLVRPFIVNQLKLMLSKNGRMVESEFWIDKVKSHCFVTYETVEDAMKVREYLHGTRWPPSNPKVLRVDFATDGEREFFIKNDTSVSSHKSRSPMIKTNKVERDKKKERKRSKERKKTPPPIREWDIPKYEKKDVSVSEKEEKKESSHSPEREESVEPPAPATDQPAKLLDDLFKKTKTKPCVYWLPLTEEQAKEMIERKKKESAERNKLMEERRKLRRDRSRERQRAAKERWLQSRHRRSISRDHRRKSCDNKRSRSRSLKARGVPPIKKPSRRSIRRSRHR